MAHKDPMEESVPDDEDSGCIGAETTPEIIVVQADAESGPDADKVYGPRW